MKSHPTQFWKVTDGAVVVVVAAAVNVVVVVGSAVVVVGSAAAVVVVVGNAAAVVVEKQKLGFLFLLNRVEPTEKKDLNKFRFYPGFAAWLPIFETKGWVRCSAFQSDHRV